MSYGKSKEKFERKMKVFKKKKEMDNFKIKNNKEKIECLHGFPHEIGHLLTHNLKKNIDGYQPKIKFPKK